MGASTAVLLAALALLVGAAGDPCSRLPARSAEQQRRLPQARGAHLLRLRGGEAAVSAPRAAAGPGPGPHPAPGDVVGASRVHGADIPGMEGEVGPHGIRIRQAMLADVPQLQRINLVCLPENYHQQSYWFHILRWPTLIRVAEARLGSSSSSSSSAGGGGGGGEGDGEWVIVAYVLAKIDDSAEDSPSVAVASSGHSSCGAGLAAAPVKGHITSLAVMRTHRRLGIAKRLMESSLMHMASEYRASSCSLHVRSSNKAAVDLYRMALGFKVEKTVAAYYGDGEDGMCMLLAALPSPCTPASPDAETR